MSGFKLLAIRPLEGCDPKYLKNLKEGMVYKFYQDYKMIDSNDKEISRDNDNLHQLIASVLLPEIEVDLYSQGDLKINVSAIVGKNGSGKSAITELFLKAMFDLSIENDIISKEKLEFQFEKEKEFIESQIEKIEQSLDELSCEGNNLRGTSFFNIVTEQGVKLSNYYQRIHNSNEFINKLDDYDGSALYFELIGQFGNDKPFIIRKSKGEKKYQLMELIQLKENTLIKSYFTLFS